MSAPLIRLDFRLPDTELGLPPEMLAPPPSLRSLVFNPTSLSVLGLLVLGGGGLLLSTWSLQQREANIRASITSLNATRRQHQANIEKAESLHARRAQIRQYLDTVAVVDSNRYGVVHALEEFARLRPADLWLERVETVRMDPATKVTILRLVGIAPTDAILAEYQRNLEGSVWLRNIQNGGTERVTIVGQEAVRFTFTAETRRPEPEFLTTEAITPEGLTASVPRNAPTLAPVLGGGPLSIPDSQLPRVGGP